MKIISREYKAILAHDRFADRADGVERFWSDLEDAAGMIDRVRVKGELDQKRKRSIAFLDTPDLTLGRHGLVLRRRAGDEAIQYTIKCRSEDRYFAAGTDLRAAKGMGAEEKLEEDIAPPFRCRFSHSTTVTLPGADQRNGTPEDLSAAAAFFPVLGALRVDGRACRPDTPLFRVNNLDVFERVYTGAKVVFDLNGAGKRSEDASVALILWSIGKEGRPLVAEVSFRLKDADERFGRDLADAARSFFALMQRMDWCRPDGVTKTQLVYRHSAGT